MKPNYQHNYNKEAIEYFDSILGDLGIGLINYGFQNNKDISEVHNLLKRDKILSKRYHLNLIKNLYRYVLLIPFSEHILKQFYKVK